VAKRRETKNDFTNLAALARAIPPQQQPQTEGVVMLKCLVRRVGARRLWEWLALLSLCLISADAMALSCPDNRESSGGLCYLKPRDGYSCTATLCVQNCRDGYHSTGIGTCHYSGSTTYTQRPYLTRSHSGMQRCLALFYNNCRDGYHMDVCGICSYQGAWDITRASYDRGAGTNPDMSAAFNRLSDTTRATWGRLLAGIQTGFAQLLASLQALEKAALHAAVVTLAKEAVAVPGLSAQLDDVGAKLAALQQNAESLNILKRLAVAGATGKADAQVAKDMLYVATHLGVVDNKSGIKAFGVYQHVEALAGGGASNQVGIAMNVPASLAADPAKMDPRAFMSQGLVFGPEAGTSVGFGIFLIKGDVRSLNGPEMSVGLDAAVAAGVNVGVGLSVPTKWPAFPVTTDLQVITDAYTAWLRPPSLVFSVGISSGAEAGAAVTFGYGSTIQLK
jgi:hypothetical protein